ncbi:GNAT family N-acetyltransferase [Devosia epidermidihirudinis]|uniref:GNAT family N-acetyltransferase n=1 Tax=Devosia epidermidihirudinis TaxID=1293439 RepID=UPI000AB35178|nr:GNAT family protein [Devosia epidermidihirudinis]
MSFLLRMRVLAETELVTERLVLEPLRPDHAVALLAGLQDEQLYRFIPQDPPADLAWLTARFTRISTRGPADGNAVWMNWAIRCGDVYCGQFEATATENGSVDIAYFIFTAYQRQGLAKEAARAVVAALLNDPDLRMIGASLDTRNEASAGLVEALGFARIATVKDADFFKGASSDEYRYELTRPS